MANTKPSSKGVRLSDKQKEVVRSCREYNYDIAHNTSHDFYEYEKGRKSVSKYLSTRLAKALIDADGLFVWKYSTETKNVYELTETGKTIDIQ